MFWTNRRVKSLLWGFCFFSGNILKLHVTSRAKFVTFSFSGKYNLAICKKTSWMQNVFTPVVLEKELVAPIYSCVNMQLMVPCEVWEDPANWAGNWVLYEQRKRCLCEVLRSFPVRSIVDWGTKNFSEKMKINCSLCGLTDFLTAVNLSKAGQNVVKRTWMSVGYRYAFCPGPGLRELMHDPDRQLQSSPQIHQMGRHDFHLNQSFHCTVWAAEFLLRVIL